MVCPRDTLLWLIAAQTNVFTRFGIRLIRDATYLTVLRHIDLRLIRQFEKSGVQYVDFDGKMRLTERVIGFVSQGRPRRLGLMPPV